MAGITQTIPNFVGGMSEQPDNLKFPGQVKEIVNGVPDITRGLFKRPGSERIGLNALSGVVSGGSWFHYFRDESEGAYIGQIENNGVIRIWSCETGVSQIVLYKPVGWASTKDYSAGEKVHMNDKVYEAQADISSGGSAPTHSSGTVNNWLFIEATSVYETRVKNYLTTSTPENLQFLTINDSTFVNNRDDTDARKQYTTVGTTGTTDATPDAHFGFIELLRTENGRQYGVNINNGATVTTLTRATKIKITDNSYDEGDGSGHCPGIGTEVFAVTAKSSYGSSENITHVKNSGGTTVTSGKTNLTFRVTALGQQGVSPNYSANTNGPGGQNYRCSYNIEAVLLHGGEGWAVGDVIRVIPESASNANSSDSQAYVDVTVTEIESTQVNATISSNGDGLIRPSPTPFDADTAVTADTIIGGIIDNLPSGVTGKHIGTGIYLSSTNPFSVEVVEEDLMRCFQSSVNDVQNLPNQCKHGYIVKISNSRMAQEDDYYLRFDGENNRDGAGSWSECAKPGIAKTLTNMPIVIQRTGFSAPDNKFIFSILEFKYADRKVGDDVTNPLPTFVGSRINKVLFFRNRLAFLSGENVITSRPGTLGEPDFFIETALTVSASDPIDISAASMFPSELFDGIEINTGLLVFSTNQQFLLSSDDTVLNPDTAKLRSVSTFNYNKDMPPISLGTTVAYIDNSGKFSRLNEMANVRREGEPNVVEVSKVVPSLIPKDIDLMTNSRENSIVLLGKTNVDTVIGYKYFQVSEQRQQASWFTWKFNNKLIYHFIIDDEYFFLDEDYYLQKIRLIQGDDDPSVTTNDVNYLLHLDNNTTLNGGVFDASAGTTTFSSVGWLNTVTTPNYSLAVVDKNGRYGVPTVSGTTLTLTGNWSNSQLPSGQTAFDIGYVYDYEVQFPTLYPTKAEGGRVTSDVNSSLVLHRIKLHFGKVGSYRTTLNRVGKVSYTDQHESSIVDQTEAADVPFLPEFIKTVPVYERNINVDIILKSIHPSPATLHAMSWEGDYSPKFYKRV